MPLLLDRLYHLHWVTPDLARAAQPYLGFYAEFLKPHGFRSLVNLRGENADYRWWRHEKDVANALGIAHFDVKLSSRNLPARGALARLFDAFENAATPLLVKCSGGQDRSSLASALWLLRRNGAAALPQAEGQFAFWPYLHRPKSYQLWLKHFPAYAVEQSDGTDLVLWARGRYDPRHFAEWLAARHLPRAFRAFQAEAPEG